MEIILAVDVGNTNIDFGIFREGRLKQSFKIPTHKIKSVSLQKFFQKLKPQEAIICSVVPKLNRELERKIKKIVGKKPFFVGKDIFVPLKNLYRNPKQVGQDRLVNAYAASRLYQLPAVVVDFGTAITFDVISKKKEYLGGMILPGLSISLEALYKNTALLPKIKLSKPQEFIGKDTKNSILSGIIYGFSCLTDELTRRIRKIIGKNTLLIGTGGNIKLIFPYCQKLNKIDPFLTLKGLFLLSRNCRKKV